MTYSRRQSSFSPFILVRPIIVDFTNDRKLVFVYPIKIYLTHNLYNCISNYLKIFTLSDSALTRFAISFLLRSNNDNSNANSYRTGSITRYLFIDYSFPLINIDDFWHDFFISLRRPYFYQFLGKAYSVYRRAIFYIIRRDRGNNIRSYPRDERLVEMVYDVRASEAARESGGERSLRLFSDGASAAPSLGETRINYCTSSAKPSVGPDR